MIQITVCGKIDPRAVEQLQRCANEGNALGAAICADGHLGYSMPIGGVVAYRDYVSPSGVGYDIGCGNKAVATNLLYSDISSDIKGIMDEIARRISFGMGVPNDERVDHEVLDNISKAEYSPLQPLAGKAAAQLGTVGSGNHYVDLFRDLETDRVWIGVHFGSRGFGHTVASGFLALAQGLSFDERAKEGEMDSPPVLLHTESALGHMYIQAMQLAGEYAYAGRDAVCDKVLEILGGEEIESIHNHHNYAWLEEHAGEKVWVVRKGATPAFPSQKGFVGATMGEPSVILEGADYTDNPIREEARLQRSLMFSTVHGAGRVMSRTQAAGKVKRKKYWECRGHCREIFDHPPKKQETCDICKGPIKKKFHVEKVREGEIDWKAVTRDLRHKHIELRGGAADEAPGAYKRLDAVLGYHAGTINVLHELQPVGVAMAGGDIKDPYKD